MPESLYPRYLQLLEGDEETIRAAHGWAHRLARESLSGIVAICVEDPLRFSLIFLEVLRQGATPLIMPSAEELARFGVTTTVRDEGLESTRGSCQLQASPDTYLAFSSGSTGQRKPLRFALSRALDNARTHANSLGLAATHQIIQTLRIHHSFGVIAYILTPLVSGARIELGVYFDSLFSPQRQASLPHSVAHLTPYHIQFLLRRKVRSSRKLARLTVGAGPMRKSEAHYASTLCHQLYVTYGLSEAGPRVTTGLVDPLTFEDGWIGHALEGVEHRLDEQQCLWLRCPRYASLDVDKDSFFNTGDRVEALNDASLIFRNRINDVLRIRGQTYPRSLYVERLCEFLKIPCEIGQRMHSDELVVFLENSTRDGQAVDKVRRAFPEFREATFVWRDKLARSVLGKTDLPSMMAEIEGDSWTANCPLH